MVVITSNLQTRSIHLSSVSARSNDPGRSIDTREERAWASKRASCNSLSDTLALHAVPEKKMSGARNRNG